MDMSDIKTNAEKIMMEFNQSILHPAPKKLEFDNFSESATETNNSISKKRRLSPSLNESSEANGIEVGEVSLNASSNMQPPPSPWEVRRIKADYIEATARIAKFKKEIERLHRIRAEIETNYESKVKELTKQCDFSSNKIIDLEKHLNAVRNREQAAKVGMTKAENELSKQKILYEEKIEDLKRLNIEIEESSRLNENSLKNELSEFRSHTQQLEGELELMHEEFENLKNELEKYKEKSSWSKELEYKLEKEQQELQMANSRIKTLENQIASYDDWKQITETCQTKFLNAPDMEKEIERLRKTNKNLHEALGNKLLLEEQVYDLRSRLEKAENAKSEAVVLQVKLNSTEQELKEWVKIAQDHCLPNTLVSPIALRARIEQILQNDIIIKSEKNSSLCEKNSIDSQLQDSKQKIEQYTKNIETLRSALKNHKNYILRLQKKLLFITRERDSYKQLLENFEKDLTISSTVEISNSEARLRSRVDMLEKTLNGYKEMCSTLEKELSDLKLGPGTDGVMDTAFTTETFDYMKKELDQLRLENERLARRKDELELELEHRCLKGDFNIGRYKVVHLSKNPAAEAYENANNFVEKLQAEIERLKRRNQQLIEDQESTTRLDETSGLTVNIKENNQLRAEIEQLNAKIRKLKEVYKSTQMEFREVCYMLFGYKVDKINHTNYTISSMYAESADDYLSFRLNENGNLDLLENDYSISWNSLVESQLITNKSLPVFLSTLTIELFSRTTVA